MSERANNHILEDRRYVTLILRLVLDGGGRLIQGELVDTTDTRRERFIGASGLNQSVATWLRHQEQAGTDGEP